MNLKRFKRTLVLFGWLATVTMIVLLSVFGRPLQFWAAASLGYNTVAWIIGLALIGLVTIYLFWQQKGAEALPWLNLAWILPLFLVLPMLVERVEERMHFLVFGLYGAFSLLLFGPRMALLVCLLGAAGDELLQWMLPDRVGDWRDVTMNLLAALAAALFVLMTTPDPIGQDDEPN